MVERIDKLLYDSEENKTNLFFDGPVEFLCRELAAYLRGISPFKDIYGDFIDGYKRMDYPIRSLPAIRIYNNYQNKDFDSWFINGDLIMDAIFPASIRRAETQQIPDTIAAALLQQFRRPSFFSAMEAVVPGLNELGKSFTVDKALAFDWNEQEVPLTQMTINFRIDLRIWDDYLESTDRTKDSPFVKAIADLDRIVTVIKGLRDDDTTTEVEVGVDQNDL